METLQNVEDEQSVTFSSPPQGIDLGDFDDKLRASIQLLPSCQRCKRLRRKCDTNLPSCRLCQKANVECSFYDHSLQQILPRSYVLSLLTRAQELKEAKKSSANKPSLPAVPPSPMPPVLNTAPGVETVSGRHKPSQDNFDEHFMLTTPTNSTSRFFGSSSVFVLTVRLASRVFDDFSLFKSPENPLFDLTEVEGGINDPNLVLKSRISIYSREMLLTLTGHYMSSLNTLYPFIDEFTISHDLEVFLDNQINEASGPSKVSGKTAYQYFRIAMICAIACANKSRHKPHLVASDDDFYAKGMRYVEAVTSEVSGESLQALMLLIVYCLFHPRKGDIWKLLDYACRLSVELGYHTELPSDEDSSRDMSLRRSTFWGLYTIERIVGQIFGRPSDLPEQIITTEYPGILVTGSPTDRASVQVFSAAHHYRLVYLRSEIYREIYLPTSPFVHDLEWFIDRYFTLSQWYEEIQINEELAGVGTSTCNVAYHSTIVFLFQPLLLRALSENSKLNLRPTTLRVTPSENYRSACQLIRTYERIMRAPDDTALGIYAMTIMSAHYIYLAGLTIMAHAHLSIDSQIKTLSPLIPGVSERTTQPIDYSEIYEVSGSCLVLLTWCASTWKGMSGMLDMYKRLSEKLLPMLAGKGLV